MPPRSITRAPEIIGDRELEQLAAEPIRPLFPLLNQAEAMVPLVVVLACLPALYAVANRTLTEQGALQGLEGLRILSLSAGSDSNFPAAVEQLDKLRFQPPLMCWLTALCLKVFGIARELGLVASAYLCTAGLLGAAYALGRRLGGESLGLVSVAILAFHPLILRGVQQPVPQSAAILFAILSLVGIVAHWQKSTSIASYQLLLGGISLGLCLLAGGPVALAVVVILLLYVTMWKIEARWRRGTGIVWDRSQFSRRTALRSTAVLAATAFALAGWHVLLLSSRYGAEFWQEWWLPAPAATVLQLTHRPLWLALVPELAQLTLPFLGLTLLGLGSVIRDVGRGEEDPARRHRFILFPWIAVALLAWAVAHGSGHADQSTVMLWETFLAVPLVIAAALGFIEIAARRVGFAMAVAAGLLTMINVAVLAMTVPTSDNGAIRAETGPIVWVVGNPLIVLLLVAAAVALVRAARGDEIRKRWLLTGMLATIVVGNGCWGLSLPQNAGGTQRELEDLRSGLARQSDVARLTFVGLTRAGQVAAREPPARLIFGMASVWPRAAFNFESSWEGASPPGDSERRRDSEGPTLFVAWSPRGVVRGPVPDATLKLAAPPFLFEDLEIAVYIRDRERP